MTLSNVAASVREQVFTVHAKENSTTYGTGVNTEIQVNVGDTLKVRVPPEQKWCSLVRHGDWLVDRYSNADGLKYEYRSGTDQFPYGTLVGSFDDEKNYFKIGTSFNMVMERSGTLKLWYWDSDKVNNDGAVTAFVSVIPPATQFFTVCAIKNSHGGGTAMETGIQVEAGDRLVVDVPEAQEWCVKLVDGNWKSEWISNADGVQSKINNFNRGALVGSLEGNYFKIGTNYNKMMSQSGELKLWCWDDDSQDNDGAVTASASIAPGHSPNWLRGATLTNFYTGKEDFTIMFWVYVGGPASRSFLRIAGRDLRFEQLQLAWGAWWFVALAVRGGSVTEARSGRLGSRSLKAVAQEQDQGSGTVNETSLHLGCDDAITQLVVLGGPVNWTAVSDVFRGSPPVGSGYDCRLWLPINEGFGPKLWDHSGHGHDYTALNSSDSSWDWATNSVTILVTEVNVQNTVHHILPESLDVYTGDMVEWLFVEEGKKTIHSNRDEKKVNSGGENAVDTGFFGLDGGDITGSENELDGKVVETGEKEFTYDVLHQRPQGRPQAQVPGGARQ